MSHVLGEKASSDVSSDATTHSQHFQDQLETILRKLRTDASSITAGEARLLSENVATSDERAGSSYHQAPHRSLLTAAKDLHAAVDSSSPGEVTTEVLRTAQSIVSKMQRAAGQTKAPQPEAEAMSSPKKGRSRANSRSFTVPQQQPRHVKEKSLDRAEVVVKPDIDQGAGTTTENDTLNRGETCTYGDGEKSELSATVQSFVSERRLARVD